MAYIAGISDSIKEALKDICREKRMTQVEWVEQKVNEDLEALTPRPAKRKEAADLAKHYGD